MKMLHTNLLLSAVLLLVVFAQGCETSRGLGQDVENTGENIQQGVDRVVD